MRVNISVTVTQQISPLNFLFIGGVMLPSVGVNKFNSLQFQKCLVAPKKKKKSNVKRTVSSQSLVWDFLIDDMAKSMWTTEQYMQQQVYGSRNLCDVIMKMLRHPHVEVIKAVWHISSVLEVIW